MQGDFQTKKTTPIKKNADALCSDFLPCIPKKRARRTESPIRKTSILAFENARFPLERDQAFLIAAKHSLQ